MYIVSILLDTRASLKHRPQCKHWAVFVDIIAQCGRSLSMTWSGDVDGGREICRHVVIQWAIRPFAISWENLKVISCSDISCILILVYTVVEHYNHDPLTTLGNFMIYLRDLADHQPGFIRIQFFCRRLYRYCIDQALCCQLLNHDTVTRRLAQPSSYNYADTSQAAQVWRCW
jgi:hypothetical protein